jgi:hypothetical protein
MGRRVLLPMRWQWNPSTSVLEVKYLAYRGRENKNDEQWRKQRHGFFVELMPSNITNGTTHNDKRIA